MSKTGAALRFVPCAVRSLQSFSVPCSSSPHNLKEARRVTGTVVERSEVVTERRNGLRPRLVELTLSKSQTLRLVGHGWSVGPPIKRTSMSIDVGEFRRQKALCLHVEAKDVCHARNVVGRNQGVLGRIDPRTQEHTFHHSRYCTPN